MLVELEKNPTLHFLEGGGEMGTRVRAKDWTLTSLGHPSTWPQNLRTTLSIMLNTKFPMFLWWGDEMIQFYNDAYRPSLGNDGKHPHALGAKAIDTWQEIWPIIYPLMERVKFGDATWSEDQLVPIYRNGKIEDVYWTFGYSPVKNEDGNVDGILVVCTETTDKIVAYQKLEESNRRFHANVTQAPVAMCVLRGESYIVEIANKLVLEIWGKTAEQVMHKPIFEGLPEAQNQGLEQLLETVYKSGGHIVANERPVNLPRGDKIETRYLNFVYQSLHEADGSVSGIMAVATDVTDQVHARQKITDLEERWRLAIDASGLGTYDLNMITDEAVCSPRFHEIFGLSSDVPRGDYVALMHPDDLHIRSNAFLTALQTNRLTYECRIVRNDKSVRWIRVDGKVYRDDDGNPVRMLGTLKDITEEHAFAQALEQKVNERTRELHEEKLFAEAILNASGDIISVFDREMRYLTVNDTTEEKYQVHRDQLIGKRMHEVFPQTKDGPLYKAIQRTFNGELLKPFQHTSLVNGRQYETQVVPLKQSGLVTAVLAIAHDYTDMFYATEQIRIANEMLAQKNRELQNMNNELASFAYVASHDLQEPLRKIQVFTGRIKSTETLSVRAADYFDRMQSAAVRMQKLIEDLLSYSRTNTAQRVFETIDANHFVKEVLESLSDTVRSKSAEVSVQGTATVRAIPFQLNQLLNNVIANALKFSHPKRTPKITIQIQNATGDEFNDETLIGSETYCHISVSDNGIGFEPEYSDKIFEVFQRLHGRNEYEGTGIGLAICKKIVENHQGVITAISEPDKGATFDIYLPA